MKTLQINAAAHAYTITVGKGLRFKLSDFLHQEYSKILVVTDDAVAPLFLQDVLTGLPKKVTYPYTIPQGEKSKSIEMYYTLHTYLMEHHFDRNALVVALGGGVVGDLAGFVAATYMRGIDYIQVPTTILAHDSSVGGKVAINHELGKNMIGSFYPPVAVVYDVSTLETLPEEEVRSGYAELIKEAFIADSDFLYELLDLTLTDVTEDDLIRHLYSGMTVKAHIVEQDERETKIRKYLNFGHTLAHALETEHGYGKMTHGEAVAIGMLFALQLSANRYPENFPIHRYYEWLQRNGYPLKVNADPVDLMEHMKHDKKAHGEMLQFVILEELACPVIEDMSVDEAKQALAIFIKGLNAG